MESLESKLLAELHERKSCTEGKKRGAHVLDDDFECSSSFSATHSLLTSTPSTLPSVAKKKPPVGDAAATTQANMDNSDLERYLPRSYNPRLDRLTKMQAALVTSVVEKNPGR